MESLFLGITQGLTEFLPVSSSGHLYILKRVFGLDNNLLPFFIFLHLATASAIIIFLWKRMLSVLSDKTLLIHIAIITAITVIMGLAIDIFFKRLFENKYFVSLCLLINAGILLNIKQIHQKRTSKDIRLKDSIILGILQGLAIFPGISRSGITIAGFLKRGFTTKDAFLLSFLMAIPAIVGAFILKCKYVFNSGLTNSQIYIGFITAFICGLIALAIVKKTLINRKFKRFGYYCLFIAIVGLFA